jgi:hypothetical protein
MEKATCAVCERSFPISAFRKRKDVAGSIDPRCKECEAKRRREYYASGAGSYPQARAIAKRTRRDFTLTKEEYDALRTLPCHYCGWPTLSLGIGLDRLELDGDYTPDNVVSCCVECNFMRGNTFTPDEMKRHIGPAIALIKERRKAKGIATPAECHAEQSAKRGRPRKYTEE